jgi:hypothetical protein
VLRTAVSSVKDELSQAQKSLDAFKGLKSKPSEIATKLKRLEELEAIDPESEADKRAALKAQTMIDAKVQEYEGKLTPLQEELKRRRAQIEKLSLEQAARTAAARHKGDPELLMPFVRQRTRTKENDEGEIVFEVLNDSGAPDFAVHDGKALPATIDDLMLGLKNDAKYGRLFEGSGRSGSESQHSNGSGKGKTITRKDFEALNPVERHKTVTSGIAIVD